MLLGEPVESGDGLGPHDFCRSPRVGRRQHRTTPWRAEVEVRDWRRWLGTWRRRVEQLCGRFQWWGSKAGLVSERRGENRGGEGRRGENRRGEERGGEERGGEERRE